MTSQEWNQRITETENQIAQKEERFAQIPAEKSRLLALNDEKKLLVVEQEEEQLPEQVARLQKRIPLLKAERETALKTEAEARVLEIEKASGAITERISQETRALRQLMSEVLSRSESLHPNITEIGSLRDEAEYLRQRFGTRQPTTSDPERLHGNEVSDFVRKIEFALRFQSFRSSRWVSLLDEWTKERDAAARRSKRQEEAQKSELERRAEADRLKIEKLNEMHAQRRLAEETFAEAVNKKPPLSNYKPTSPERS